MSKGKSNGSMVVVLQEGFRGAVVVKSGDTQKLLSDAKSKPKHDKKQTNEVCAKGNGKPQPVTITVKPNREAKVVEPDKKKKNGADWEKAEVKKQITEMKVKVKVKAHRVAMETNFSSSRMAYREVGYTHQVVKESVVTSSSGCTYQKVSSSKTVSETVTRSKR